MIKPASQAPAEIWPIVWDLATRKPWPPRDDDDLQPFFEYANRELLLPLLLTSDNLPKVVMTGRARYRPFLALYRKRYELVRTALPEFSRIAGADTFVFFKGADFCHRLYARPELRPMADVDVLVPASTFEDFLSRFAREGIDRRRGAHGTSFSPDHYETSLMIGEVHIEVHRAFAQRIRASIDYKGLWTRRESFESDGVIGRRFSAPDALLCQAYELAKDEFRSPLIRYVDFFLLARDQTDALSICVERAAAWKIERAFFGALFLASRLFPALQVPEVTRALDALVTPRERTYLLSRVLPDPAREQRLSPSGRGLQILRKLSLIDSRWRRLAFLGFAAQQEVKGSLHEWRMRRAGAAIPPRWGRGRA